jgi:hypothetical protein
MKMNPLGIQRNSLEQISCSGSTELANSDRDSLVRKSAMDSDINSIYSQIYPQNIISTPFAKELYRGQPKLKQRSDWYETRAGIWPVQAKPSGWMPNIMKALGERFCQAIEQHSKVLIVRFDLHVPEYTEDNAFVSEFMKKLSYWIKYKYKGVNEVRYLWVRELEKVKQQHYHVVLMLNGNKIRNPRYIHDKGKEIWSGLRGTIYHYVKKFHHFHRDDHDKICEAFYHISYLAKARGKGYKPHHTKNYGASRL